MNKMVTKMRGALAHRSNDSHLLHAVPVRRFSLGSYSWVLLTVLIVSLYYGFIASDRYVTVASVYVKATDTGGGVIPQLQILSPSSGDLQENILMHSFLSSQDMLDILEREIDFSEHFADKSWDFYSRLSSETTKEARVRYFNKHLTTALDPDLGILTIRGQGFTPEFSLKVVQATLVAAETFVNSIGQKIALQEIAFVEKELDRSRLKLQQAQANLLDFQNEHGLLSAEASGALLQQLIGELEGDLARMKTRERTQATFFNEDAAQLVLLRERITAVTEQIAVERTKLATRNGQSFSDLNARAQELQLELGYHRDLYKAALLSLEKARVESFKKLKHLVVIQSPQLPEEAKKPRKLYNITSLFIALSLAYGIIVMIMATIREHRDV